MISLNYVDERFHKALDLNGSNTKPTVGQRLEIVDLTFKKYRKLWSIELNN